MEQKNKKIVLLVGTVLVIGIIVCFGIAYKNYKNDSVNKTTLDSSTINSGGSYQITGNKGCITINTQDSVELELNNASITCDNGPGINVVSAKKVTIILSGKNTINATTTEELDAAIYSKEDLLFKGDGKAIITSNYDGIASKDSLTFNEGSFVIEAAKDGIKGKDDIVFEGGAYSINASEDGIKTTNEEDTSKGYIIINDGAFTIESVGDGIQAVTSLTIEGGAFSITTTGSDSAKGIKASSLIEINDGAITIDSTDDGIHSDGNVVINDGTFTITSTDDAIHADGMVEINDGTFTITAHEGIEATYVKINDGEIVINASDDGINAGNKSSEYQVAVEINGGKLTIKMGQGDTDGIDANGNIYVNGGTVIITGQSAFDYDGEAKYNGGTIIVNGTTINSISNQFAGDNNQGMNFGGERRR